MNRRHLWIATTTVWLATSASVGRTQGFLPPAPSTAVPRFTQSTATQPTATQPTATAPPATLPTATATPPTATPPTVGAGQSPAVKLTSETIDQVPEQPIALADLICVVGEEHILAGDMMIYVDPVIEENRKNLGPGQEDIVRKQLLRKVLQQYVEVKALYQEFFRQTAGNAAPAEAKETQQKIRSKASKLFFEKQVPNLLKAHDVTDIKALEEKLRSKSMSIGQLQQRFVEQVLASEAERRQVPEDVEIGREELMQYYSDHADEWKQVGRAKWRQLTARFDRFPSKAAAKAAIEAMGNEVYLGGKPFEAVAKASSQGFSAKEGGVFDWTTQGALKSKPIDEALFTIPPRRLSQVIEDEVGYHIIEVLERADARTITFEEAHDEMHTAISTAKKNELRDAFHKRVMERTVIWTRWPEDIPGSRSLAEVLAE